MFPGGKVLLKPAMTSLNQISKCVCEITISLTISYLMVSATIILVCRLLLIKCERKSGQLFDNEHQRLILQVYREGNHILTPIEPSDNHLIRKV